MLPKVNEIFFIKFLIMWGIVGTASLLAYNSGVESGRNDGYYLGAASYHVGGVKCTTIVKETFCERVE